jgi:nucleoporin NUP82
MRAEGSPPPFLSLLSSEPYHVPQILTGSGLPSMPKLALPKSSSSKEIVLTPDVMRYLTKASQHTSSQIRDIKLAFHAATLRMQLQKDELNRLVATAKTMNEKVGVLQSQRKTETEARLERIQDTQKELLARLERLLSALMKKALPELSDHETKWFEELKRMKQEVLGAGKYDGGSLVTRSTQVGSHRYFY